MEDKNKIAQIAAQLLNAPDVKTKKEPAKKPRAPRKPKPTLSIVINGGKDFEVINGNKTVHQTINHYNKVTPIKPGVIVQTGVGVIDAQQKARLLELINEVVKTSVVGKKPKTHASVMFALKKYMKVNSYHEILDVEFKKAEAWLVKQIAIKTSLPSASKKIADWRNRRIKAIHARCKEIDIVDWRISYMKKKFGKESMLDLPDDGLEALYRTVMNKKLS